MRGFRVNSGHTVYDSRGVVVSELRMLQSILEAQTLTILPMLQSVPTVKLPCCLPVAQVLVFWVLGVL